MFDQLLTDYLKGSLDCAINELQYCEAQIKHLSKSGPLALADQYKEKAAVLEQLICILEEADKTNKKLVKYAIPKNTNA